MMKKTGDSKIKGVVVEIKGEKRQAIKVNGKTLNYCEKCGHHFMGQGCPHCLLNNKR